MLSYPSGGTLEGSDYILFQHYEYKSREQRTIGAAPPSGGDIRLYMPNSTPQISNSQGWSDVSIPGPIGQAVIGAANAAGEAVGVLAGADGADMRSSVDKLKGAFTGAMKNGRGIVGQIGVNMIASKLPLNAKQLTSLSMGKIYNPNTELTYDGPGLRSFGMGFNFVPKNAAEARIVSEIIREFKVWGAPEEQGGGMFELPHVWKVTYVSGGRVDTMNRFKPAALTDVTVQANPSLSHHSTYTDGTPVETAINLSFKEVELITRQDHTNVGGQGF